MTELRTAALRALEALEYENSWHKPRNEKPYVSTLDAIVALKAALAEPNHDYERGFVDGMLEQARRSVDKAVNAMAQKRGCRVCGIGANGETVGYVCYRDDCPTRITCGGAV